MVNVDIYHDVICWYNDDEYFHYYYHIKYLNGECIFYDDEGYPIRNCKSKVEYYRLLRLKILW